MKNIRIIWWLIQINAVLCFLFFGVVGLSEASNNVKIFAFVVLIVAAILEFFAYHGIYKEHLNKREI